MDWRQIIMDSIVIAVITTGGVLLAAFITEIFMAKRVMNRLDTLRLDKEHQDRKQEHTDIQSDIQLGTRDIQKVETTLAMVREDQVRDTTEKRLQMEALKDNDKELARSIENMQHFKDQWILVHSENIQLKQQLLHLRERYNTLVNQRSWSQQQIHTENEDDLNLGM